MMAETCALLVFLSPSCWQQLESAKRLEEEWCSNYQELSIRKICLFFGEKFVVISGLFKVEQAQSKHPLAFLQGHLAVPITVGEVSLPPNLVVSALL